MEVKKKDREFLSALKKVYEGVTGLPKSTNALEVRQLCNHYIRKAFSHSNFQIKGSEYLPYEKNSIFIYNHLNNHPYYTEDEGFQITLDSHFISSLILEKYYNDSGIRVVRHSLPEEVNHKAYYERLNYIRVYSKNYIPEGLEKEEIITVNKSFYAKAIDHLNQGSGMVFSPEGNSYPTHSSPGIFRPGAFKLACMMDPQPLIVPLVLANFDQLSSKSTFKCDIKPPFRLSDWGVTNSDDASFLEAVNTLNHQYKKWVMDLKSEENGFEGEIAALEDKIKIHKQKDNSVVFYGSSTLRLWKSTEEDFPNANILNLGFGGAFIDSLSEYFDRLFRDIVPKTLVLYLGGNDLSLDLSVKQIFNDIRSLILKIHRKFPEAIILNLCIKPSLERAHQLQKIATINRMMMEESQKLFYLKQIDFYHTLLNDGKVDPQYFLQDGLHLNKKGYKILRNALKPHF